MKKIPLKNGQCAQVDDADFPSLSQFKWTATKNGTTYYARRYEHGKTIYMHRQIMQATESGTLIDHKNGKGLDNQRHNLRAATTQQNNRNQAKQYRTEYKGVTASRNNYRARIKTAEKRINLGTFATAEQAAQAYDQAAKDHFGPFARLNFADQYQQQQNTVQNG